MHKSGVVFQVPVSEWFEPDREEHRRAWQDLLATGDWPAGFIPAEVYLDAHWLDKIEARFRNPYS
jgi:hypothetical protein